MKSMDMWKPGKGTENSSEILTDGGNVGHCIKFSRFVISVSSTEGGRKKIDELGYFTYR